MSSTRPFAVRPRARTTITAALLLALAACTTATPRPSPPSASGGAPTPSPIASAEPEVTPVPTPQPTPQYTNPPDPRLRAMIPDRVAGNPVAIPPVDQFAFTPGDVGEPYGELGLRFVALQVAFVNEPRLSLFAMQVGGPAPTTSELEPYLAAAGQYVGIAGLHREPWKLRTIGGRITWVRPEDDATLAGTMVYTWAARGYVFLMIGVDDTQNRAMFAALPAERARARGGASGTPSATASASATSEATSEAMPSSSP